MKEKVISSPNVVLIIDVTRPVMKKPFFSCFRVNPILDSTKATIAGARPINGIQKNTRLAIPRIKEAIDVPEGRATCCDGSFAGTTGVDVTSLLGEVSGAWLCGFSRDVLRELLVSVVCLLSVVSVFWGTAAPQPVQKRSSPASWALHAAQSSAFNVGPHPPNQDVNHDTQFFPHN